ncbi:MAG: polynucleotide adenylyltransferase PcnB [Porticoccaceae bacterium]
MLEKITRFFRKKPLPAIDGEPHVIRAGDHPLSPRQITSGAKKVVEQLVSDGYDAYLVGGCVRDLMLGMHPKDFDVATDATPEEVNKLFRRARIVGRRFQIVHVRMGSEIIEVTTFRAHHSAEHNGKDQSRRSSRGLLLRDNIFGSIAEDACRRDFTMNALYYHPQDNSVFDYANGLHDIEHRLIRVIGKPEERYREDPVRMLRAVRFAAKLGFRIEENTARPIEKMSHLLADIPPARLFDEIMKLFMHGHALATFRLLREYGLFRLLFPATEDALAQDPGYYVEFLEQAMTNTDKRIRADKRVTPAFLLAALLWPAVLEMRKKFERNNASSVYTLQQAIGEVIHRACQRVAIPRRFSMPMREIWEMQLRLPRRAGNQAQRLLENPRFRAGYDFLLLREDAGEVDPGLGEWWTRFQEADEHKRLEMTNNLDQPRQGRSRRRRRPKRPATTSQGPHD